MKKFIDFDKEDQVFYSNYYLEDYDVVLKIVIGDDDDDELPKIAKFDFTNCIFLINHDQKEYK